MIWDSLAFLKFKVPQIDLKDTLSHVETHMDKKNEAEEIFTENHLKNMRRHSYTMKMRRLRNESGVIDPALKIDRKKNPSFKRTILVRKSNL
jgi:hypothetical protein